MRRRLVDNDIEKTFKIYADIVDEQLQAQTANLSTNEIDVRKQAMGKSRLITQMQDLRDHRVTKLAWCKALMQMKNLPKLSTPWRLG